VVLTVVGSAIAQQADITRSVLRSIDFPAGYTTVTAIVERAGHLRGPSHSSSIDSGFVIQGDLVLNVDGKPEQTLTTGDSYETQPLVPPDACSVSGDKLIDSWVIERGKPLSSPAPRLVSRAARGRRAHDPRATGGATASVCN
jgi:hypothetical protein